ncbi:gliding motility-associated C-terminal domain-containing protein [uncultured Cytophaga sp.]|uniref:T9SS type B sorting domain-containing protein n=1 Tax=uncultured Cytophaga sp. TaxID=160238 RepID=UPI00261F2C0E|nr:gliding motility-associated C-terminal domain-containing protein [uncultured Cytophaga sp.]
MKKNILLVFVCIAMQSIYSVNAQNCPTDLLSGQNLIVNGDFSDGFNNWQTDYNQFTSGFSTPGNLYVGTASQMTFFNNAFSSPFNGQTGVSTDKFLMIDGVCTPGLKIWKQTNIPVKPNTNYYFSFWINSLKDNPNYPGIVNLDVDGTNIGSNISAPLFGGGNPSSSGWIKYETVWNSGLTPPATVTISIEGNQTTGCSGNGGESDFAIDNISFIPGCQYGSAGPQPKLGPDQTLCGFGLAGLVLNANVPINATTTITWNDGTTGFGALAPYTKIVTEPGTYSVCVTDNGSCTKSDIIVITNSFSIDLGPDLVLCDPASVTLDAKFVGIGVTYKWYKDGAVAEGTNTNKTYFVNTPGTYKVIVTDPICGPQEDEITITTKAPKVTNKTYCNAGDITLNVTPPNDGKYKWWNSPTSIATADLLQKGGDSYTFTATPPTNYTFYVEDTASFRVTVGLPSASGLSGLGDRGDNSVDTELKFDVLTAINIDSIYITLHTYSCPTKPVVLQVTDNLGNIVGTSASYSVSAAQGCVISSNFPIKMPVGISVPAGTGYKLKMITGDNMNWYQNGMTYPQTFQDVVRFTGNNSNNNYAPNAIPSMFRWVVTAGTACARVPVQAILKSCFPPVADAGTNIPLCNTRTTKLNAGPLESDETGEWKLATGSIGSVNPANSATGTLTFTGDTAFVVWTVTNGVGFDRDTVMVTTTTVNKPTVNGPSETCPNISGLLFTASPDNTLTGSTYQWTVLSGDLSIISGATTTEITADAGNTKSIVRVTETKNNCSAFKNDTLEISAPTEIAKAGDDATICANAYTLVGNIPKIGNGTWTTVTMDPNQVLTPIPPNKATVTNLSDNVTYEFMYQISGTCGNSTDFVKITVNVNGLKISSVTKPNDIACVGSQRQLQANVTGSSGPYTYVWNKKGTTTLDSTRVSTHIITTSAVEETYYVYVKNNTCRTDLDSVKIISIDFQKLTVPNLITPNGDGLNDVLKIVEINDHSKLMLPKNSVLKIYNSWGNEVFHADNYNNDWNAEGVSDGVYYYYVKAGCGGEEHKSWIQIIGNTK